MSSHFCPDCGAAMLPDWLLHRATYQGSPIHQIMREQAYLRNPELAEAGHQARMAPYHARLVHMQRAEARQTAKRLGLLTPRPRVQW